MMEELVISIIQFIAPTNWDQAFIRRKVREYCKKHGQSNKDHASVIIDHLTYHHGVRVEAESTDENKEIEQFINTYIDAQQN